MTRERTEAEKAARAEKARAYRQSPEYVARTQTPEYRKKKAESALRALNKPGAREARNQAQRERYASDPEYAQKKRDAQLAARSSPEYLEKQREYQRKNSLRRRCRNHNITVEVYETLLSHQGGRCVCGAPDPTNIDHDHDCCPGSRSLCGRCVRGILCRPCNLVLGLIEDDRRRLRLLSNYLKTPTGFTSYAAGIPVEEPLL